MVSLTALVEAGVPVSSDPRVTVNTGRQMGFEILCGPRFPEFLCAGKGQMLQYGAFLSCLETLTLYGDTGPWSPLSLKGERRE